MKNSLKLLDRILRGEATSPGEIKDGSFEIPIRGLVVVIMGLGMIYGACMGSYSLFRGFDATVGPPSDRWMQLIATTVKVPTLFLLTLLVTFPSLYVFNALVGSRLKLFSILRLLIVSLAVNLAVLASLGPITAFFSVSTTNYPFMVLFNVLIFTIAGGLGLSFLHQTLNRMSRRPFEVVAEVVAGITEETDEAAADRSDSMEVTEQDDTPDLEEPDAQTTDSTETKPIGALEGVPEHLLSKHVRLVFRIWIVVFCLVGAQMGWVLRPFVGDPGQPFAWVRYRESNFFEAIIRILGALLTGDL